MRSPGFRFLVAIGIGILVLSTEVGRLFPALGTFWPAMHSPWGPLLTGNAIIVLHAVVAMRMREPGDSPEIMDTNYFVGFVYTLIYLLFGLWSVRQTGIDDAWVTTFLGDLGIGLSFTVVGLVMRQLSVLQGARAQIAQQAVEVKSGTQELAEVARNLVGVAQAMQSSLGQLANPSQERAAVRVNEAVGHFEQVVGESTTRLSRAMDDLSSKSVAIATDLSGAWSNSRRSLQEHADALEQQTRIIVERLTLARSDLQHLLLETSKDATATQQMVAVTARTQVTEWEAQLRGMSENLLSIRELSERECRAAYESLGESMRAFNTLAQEVSARTANMPDPSVQLQAVWTNIAEHEAQMVDAMTRVSTVLESLGQSSLQVSEQLAELQEQARESGSEMVNGVSGMREGLVEQNRLLGELVEEVVDTLERRVQALAR